MSFLENEISRIQDEISRVQAGEKARTLAASRFVPSRSFQDSIKSLTNQLSVLTNARASEILVTPPLAGEENVIVSQIPFISKIGIGGLAVGAGILFLLLRRK